jgi:hypothetical protein
MTLRDETVYGERVGDLLPGLRAFHEASEVAEDGSIHSSVTLEPEIAIPFFRAIMRAEAELLLQDAEALGTTSEDRRTYEQRAADALVRVAQAIGAAAA